MQLDNYHIKIRERNYLEILDLALRVLRAHTGPIALAFASGAWPLIALNAWLLSGLAEGDLSGEPPMGYLFAMGLLVAWEIPLATAPLTLYLGQALFRERPSAVAIAGEFLRSLPQMLWYQAVVRAVMIPWVITWIVPFAVWPYLSEVILLERNPIRAHHRGQMTTGRRRLLLHSGYSGDLFARWLGTLGVGALLLLSCWLSLSFVGFMLFSDEAWEGISYTLYFPAALWLVVGFFAVVRFLGYLDLRIRREGWEVELLMRAERARLTRQLT